MVWLQFGFPRAGAEKKPLAVLPEHGLFPFSVDQVLERIRMLIINAIINILSGAMLFALARMYERRIFIPANDAQRLERPRAVQPQNCGFCPGRDLYSARCRRSQYSVMNWRTTT